MFSVIKIEKKQTHALTPGYRNKDDFFFLSQRVIVVVELK